MTTTRVTLTAEEADVLDDALEFWHLGSEDYEDNAEKRHTYRRVSDKLEAARRRLGL